MFFRYHPEPYGNLMSYKIKFYWNKILEYELIAINAF